MRLLLPLLVASLAACSASSPQTAETSALAEHATAPAVVAEPASETPTDRAARVKAMIAVQWAKTPCTVDPTKRLERYAVSNPGWSDRDLAGVACHKALIDMTPEMVRAAQGAPLHINRSSNGVTERQQWVYASSYLYFDGPSNDMLHLVSWQDTQ